MKLKHLFFITLTSIVLGACSYSTPKSTPTTEDEGMTMIEQQTSTAAPATNAELATYTLAEVAEHNTETDCWLIIENQVYDVTNFIGMHPGGKVIVGGCGKDATAMFNNRPNGTGPHPEEARALLPQFLIGKVE
jgi:cytochrome b involved in lipid metabolism